jgi:outer membrane autotransporter protein
MCSTLARRAEITYRARGRLIRIGSIMGRAVFACAAVVLFAGPVAAQTYVVTDNSDNVADTGSLRYAITQANANPGSTIDFASSLAGQTISLSSSLPSIEANVTINGAAAPGLTISGGNTYRVFFVDQGTVTLEHLNIVNGFAQGGSGGAGYAGGGGGLGAGGALFVNQGANVALQGVSFENNHVVGGTGGTGVVGNGALSGGGGGGLGGNGGDGSNAVGIFANLGGGGGGLTGNGGNSTGTNQSNGVGGVGGAPNGGAGGAGATNGQAGGVGGGGGGAGSTGSGGNGGDFGGGGGQGQVYAGKGGYGGGGGGGYVASGSSAGFGGGNGGGNSINSGTGGNGGSGYGGAVFVRAGGTLSFDANTSFASDGVTAGAGGTGGTAGQNGSAAGTALFLDTIQAQVNIASGTSTLSETIGGTGGIQKMGAGALVLSGANTYTGATEVAAGTLSVNGSSTSATTTVDSGATLGGSGTITGDVVNNGNVAPGDPTTLTINGNYTQNSAGNLQVQINNLGNTPGVNSSLLSVAGLASVAGTVEIQPASGTYTNGTRYTFLEAGLISGTFSGLLIDNADMHGTLSYDATDYYFTLYNGSNFAAYAQTPNQIAVANYIDNNSVGASGPMLSLIDTLGTLSPAGVRNALDQMSGALYGSVAQTDLQSTTLELSFIARRLGNGLSGVNGAPGGLATNSYGERISPTSGSLASSDLGSGLTVRGQNSLNTFWPARSTSSRWNTWGFGYGLGGNASGTSNAAGLNYSLGGTVVGLETLSENQAFGMYTGYVGSHLGSYLSGQSVGVNGGQIGTYLRRDDGINYYILLGGMGADGYNSRRLMQFGGINTTATANYGGWQSQAYLERGVTLQGSRASIQPYAALQYLYVRQNNFTETGAGVMDLKVAGIDANSLRSLIGVRLAGNSWYVNDRAITPVARALWLHEFLSTTTGLNAQFAPVGGTNFAVTGTSLGRDWAILGAGLNWNLGRGWQTYANYDAQVNIQQTFHVGSGGFQYSW